ncbi:GNAT family N-acetyltransferase [Alteromonas sp. CYL-A6]|uniref:GNAT family N-acetyltransferase n=1 Tax=Alteromonas nitratireducens TaxID=3390813 RepID=UPI0034BAA9BB
MSIREATESDWDAIWPVFHSIAREGTTYGFDRDITYEDGKRVWLTLPEYTFVYEQDGKVLGTYYLKTNHQGPGRHVCNCGYMVAGAARGQGIATRLCIHSQNVAVQSGYKAMQFNFVASSNSGAVRLWQSLGFDIVGRLPNAFLHPQQGYIDALVMYKWLANQEENEDAADRGQIFRRPKKV